MPEANIVRYEQNGLGPQLWLPFVSIPCHMNGRLSLEAKGACTSHACHFSGQTPHRQRARRTCTSHQSTQVRAARPSKADPIMFLLRACASRRGHHPDALRSSKRYAEFLAPGAVPGRLQLPPQNLSGEDAAQQAQAAITMLGHRADSQGLQ